MEGKLVDCKIKDELKSFDLLENEDYKRLNVYERILNEDRGIQNTI